MTERNRNRYPGWGAGKDGQYAAQNPGQRARDCSEDGVQSLHDRRGYPYAGQGILRCPRTRILKEPSKNCQMSSLVEDEGSQANRESDQRRREGFIKRSSGYSSHASRSEEDECHGDAGQNGCAEHREERTAGS